MVKQRLRLVDDQSGDGDGNLRSRDEQTNVAAFDLLEVVEKLQRLASSVAYERPDIARKIVAFARSLQD